MKDKAYEENVKRIFTANLSRLIKQKGKDQAYIAQIAGVSEAAVHYWVNGIKIPRMDKVQLIAKGLGVNVSDLLEEYTEYPSVSREHLKHLLFGTIDISDEKLNEVLSYAKYVKEK